MAKDYLEISNLIGDIRDYVNKSFLKKKLVKNLSLWNQLCSSLDTIEDTALAIKYYINSEETDDVGQKYIMLYGLFQSIFVQQDAVNSLLQSLGMSKIDNEEFKKIRDIRNDSTGHPTNRGTGEAKSYNFISRSSITKNRFTLLTYKGNSNEIKNICIYDEIIKKNDEILSKELEKVKHNFEIEELEHINKFKDDKMLEIVKASNYLISKIFDDYYKKGKLEISVSHIKELKKMFENFEKALIDRDKDADEIIFWKDSLLRAFDRLVNYFEYGSIDKLDAYVYIDFIRSKFNEMIKIAKEIDNYYSGENEEKETQNITVKLEIIKTE